MNYQMKEFFSPEAKSFIGSLLQADPKKRLGAFDDAQEIMEHPFFQTINWPALEQKLKKPPFETHFASPWDTCQIDSDYIH